MRVAQILYHTCPLASEEGKESGGANVYVLKLSEELSKLGVQVDMFTRSEDENTPHVVNLNPNLRLIHVKAGPEKTCAKNELIKFIPEFVENLSRYISVGARPALPRGRFPRPQGGETPPLRYDILDCHYYMSGLSGLQLEKQLINSNVVTGFKPVTTIKKLITFHTLGLIKNLVARSPSEIADSTRINAEKELVEKFDAVVAPSKNERDYLHYLYEADQKKINIVSPGFDPEIFKPMDKIEAKKKIGADPNHKIILFVGRIEPLKGIDSLFYAMKILVEKCPTCEICLWVIGGEKNQNNNNNETMKQLNNIRETLSLRNVIKYIPQQPQHTLSNFYNAADVVVMPSHYESFGLTALEAMACETPVITTNITGISGVLEKNHKSGIISAGNPLLLAEKLHQIISNEKYHDKLSIEIKESIKNLTWGNTAESVLKIYTKLLK